MKTLTRLVNRLASMLIGALLALVGLMFIALGITFLPVIGILLAIPVMMLSYYFLNLKMSVDTLGEEPELVCDERELPNVCPWPTGVRHGQA